MGFTSFLAEASADGSIRLKAPQVMRFSGPDGLVACWVSAHPAQALNSWQVSSDVWLSLADASIPAGSHWIIFEQRDALGQMSLSRLLNVYGVCHGSKTEMMFALEPLLVVAAGALDAPLVVKAEFNRRVRREELALEGTPWGPRDSWRWSLPKLSISSASFAGSP